MLYTVLRPAMFLIPSHPEYKGVLQIMGKQQYLFLLLGKTANIQQVSANVHLVSLDSEQVLKGDS